LWSQARPSPSVRWADVGLSPQGPQPLLPLLDLIVES
jgi:hypothetical protein